MEVLVQCPRWQGGAVAGGPLALGGEEGTGRVPPLGERWWDLHQTTAEKVPPCPALAAPWPQPSSGLLRWEPRSAWRRR